MVNLIVSGKNGDRMKISKLQKDIAFGIDFAEQIMLGINRDDRKVVRCILCGDCHNVTSVFKYLGIFPSRYNKAIQVGVFITLNR
jgi:hypothetical protein